MTVIQSEKLKLTYVRAKISHSKKIRLISLKACTCNFTFPKSTGLCCDDVLAITFLFSTSSTNCCPKMPKAISVSLPLSAFQQSRYAAFAISALNRATHLPLFHFLCHHRLGLKAGVGWHLTTIQHEDESAVYLKRRHLKACLRQIYNFVQLWASHLLPWMV